jgi:hypothetical protein
MPFVKRLAASPDSPERTELANLVEELRVHVFAPELKTAVPVSVSRVQEAFAKLAR